MLSARRRRNICDHDVERGIAGSDQSASFIGITRGPYVHIVVIHADHELEELEHHGFIVNHQNIYSFHLTFVLALLQWLVAAWRFLPQNGSPRGSDLWLEARSY